MRALEFRSFSPSRRKLLQREVRIVILVVDNHDSFTWNLVHGLSHWDPDVVVVESDETSVADVVALSPRGVVLSPGPGRPEQAGASLEIARQLSGHIPLLGVCLGHQVICAAFGAEVVHAPRLMHGRTSEVLHDGEGLFEGLPSPLRVARYHSLIVREASLPACLVASARTLEGELMAVRHRELAVESVQFHPESFLTSHGSALLGRWVTSLSRSPGPLRGATLSGHG
jgi:anthranilate synthase/aminodeoxychorismate synthase-like glutamine amidotransferase